jgi:hypothetical protein
MLNAAAPVGRYDDGMSERDRPGACHRRGKAVTTVIVWLLLGAILNVAVAWGCALCPYDPPAFGSSPREFYDYLAQDGSRVWLVVRFGYLHVSQRNGLQPWLMPPHIDRATYERLLPEWSLFLAGSPVGNQVDAHGNTGHMMYYEESAIGWPAFAFQSSGQRIGTGADFRTTGVQLPMWIQKMHLGTAHLPVQAIWPGFAINTVFYAAILWLLFAAPFALRKWRRIRRGMCAKCGYDLRGSPHPSPLPEGEGVPVCPECGTRLPSPSR